MAYWLFLPLAFSIGLLVYVYAINPRERTNRLFALLMLSITLNTIALFISATTDLEVLAQWTGLIHALLGFSVTGILVWFLTIELVWGKTIRPDWIKGYTAIVLLCALVVVGIILVDYLATDLVLSRPITYHSEIRYIYSTGLWRIELDLFRLVPLWGALGILAWHLPKIAKKWQTALAPVLFSLLIMPATRLLLQAFVQQPFPGIDIVGECLLVLAFAYATSRHLFVPIEIVMPQLVDSIADGVIVLDVDGQVIRVNKAAERLLGIKEPQAVHRPLDVLYTSWSGKTVSPVLDSLRETIQTLSEHTYDDTLEIAGEQVHRHIRLRINPAYNPQNKIVGYLALLTDVTTRYHHQENLERALANQKKLATMMTELASPVLPVMEQIIVLPLMGNLDVNRIDLISGTLLNGVKTHRARMIIIDLTGVQHISAGAVSTFAEALDAVRLLGAVPILVGIQPQVAEALSDLDINILVVEIDLQAGLNYATAALKNPR